MRIKISYKSLILKFNDCSLSFIKNTCHGRCCKSSNNKHKVFIRVYQDDIKNILDKFPKTKIVSNQIQPVKNRCPFQNGQDLCGLHQLGIKPFGCSVSPFTINKNGTMIIRHRYISLKCYNKIDGIPAYISFKQSLINFVGLDNYKKIKSHFNKYKTDIFIDLDRSIVDKMNDINQIKMKPTNKLKGLGLIK